MTQAITAVDQWTSSPMYVSLVHVSLFNVLCCWFQGCGIHYPILPILSVLRFYSSLNLRVALNKFRVYDYDDYFLGNKVASQIQMGCDSDRFLDVSKKGLIELSLLGHRRGLRGGLACVIRSQ